MTSIFTPPTTHRILINVSLIQIASILLYTFAATTATPTSEPSKTPRPCAWKNAESRYVQLHVEYESVLCSQYGGNSQDATPRVISAILEAEQPFVEKTCIRFNVSSVTAHCDAAKDPYSYLRLNGPKKSSYILNKFCDRWTSSNFPPQFGVAIFLTGFSSGDTAVGTAYVQGACSVLRPCAWVEGLQKETIAHELAHSFNAPHTSGPDLMAATLSYDTQFYFASSSVKIMTSFADSRRCGFRTDGSDALKNGTEDGDYGEDGLFIPFFSTRIWLVAGVIIAAIVILSLINWLVRTVRRRNRHVQVSMP